MGNGLRRHDHEPLRHGAVGHPGCRRHKPAGSAVQFRRHRADTLGADFGDADVHGDPRRRGQLASTTRLTAPGRTSSPPGPALRRALQSARKDTHLAPDEVPFYNHHVRTSMATPETAGIVALVLEATPPCARPKCGPSSRSPPGPSPVSPSRNRATATPTPPPPSIWHWPCETPARGGQGRPWPSGQAERDRTILAGLDHPDRTWAFTTRSRGPAELSHALDVRPAPAPQDVFKAPTTLRSMDPRPPWQLWVTDATTVRERAVKHRRN